MERGKKWVFTLLCVLNPAMIKATSLQSFPGLITCLQFFLSFELCSEHLSFLLWPLPPVSACTGSLLDVFVGARWPLVTSLGARTCARLPDPFCVNLVFLGLYLWWLGPGWRPAAHQSCSTTPLLSWREERKFHAWFMSWDKEREKSLTDYHHRQNRCDLIQFITNQTRAG